MSNIVKMDDFRKMKKARIVKMSWLQRFFEKTAGISKVAVERQMDYYSKRLA